MQFAKRLGCRHVQVGDGHSGVGDTVTTDDCSVAGYDDFDAENRAIARVALEVLSDTISSLTLDPIVTEKALLTRPPCRFQHIQYSPDHSAHSAIDLLIDVAHNADGITKLFMMLKRHFPGRPYRVVCGLSKEKDLDAVIPLLAKEAKEIHFVQVRNYHALFCVPNQTNALFFFAYLMDVLIVDEYGFYIGSRTYMNIPHAGKQSSRCPSAKFTRGSRKIYQERQ